VKNQNMRLVFVAKFSVTQLN